MPYLDELEQESASGILGDITDIDGLLDLDFITDVTAPTTEGGASMSSENPHAYQVGLDQLGRLAKAGLTTGLTKAAWGVNPLLGIALHTPGSFFRAGAKKLGGGTLGWEDKLELAHDFASGTPLSKFVNRFVDIIFPGSTTLDED